MEEYMDDSEEEDYENESPASSTLRLKKELSDKEDLYHTLKVKYDTLERQHKDEVVSLKSRSNDLVIFSKKKYRKLKLKYQQLLQHQEEERKKHLDQIAEVEKISQQKLIDISESKEGVQNQTLQLSQKLKWMGMKLSKSLKENERLFTLNKEYEQNLHLMKNNMKNMLGHVREKVETFRSDENERKVLQDEIMRREEIIKLQKDEFDKQQESTEDLRNNFMELKMKFQEIHRRYETQEEVITNQKKIIEDQKTQETRIKLEIEKLSHENTHKDKEIESLKREKTKQELLIMKHQHKMDLIETKLNSEIPSVQKKIDEYQSEISTLQQKMYNQKVQYHSTLKQKETEITQLTKNLSIRKNESFKLERTLNQRNEIQRKRFEIIEEQYRTKNEHLQASIHRDPTSHQVGSTTRITEEQRTMLLLTQEKMSNRIKTLSKEIERLQKKVQKRNEHIEYIKKRNLELHQKWKNEDDLKMKIIRKLKTQVELLKKEYQQKFHKLTQKYEQKIHNLGQTHLLDLQNQTIEFQKKVRTEKRKSSSEEEEEYRKDHQRHQIIIEKLLRKIEKMKMDNIKKKCFNQWKNKSTHHHRHHHQQQQQQRHEMIASQDEEDDVEEKSITSSSSSLSGSNATATTTEEKSVECTIIKSPKSRRNIMKHNNNNNNKDVVEFDITSSSSSSSTTNSNNNFQGRKKSAERGDRYDVERKKIGDMLFLTTVTRKEEEPEQHQKEKQQQKVKKSEVVVKSSSKKENQRRRVKKRGKKKKMRKRKKRKGKV